MTTLVQCNKAVGIIRAHCGGRRPVTWVFGVIA